MAKRLTKKEKRAMIGRIIGILIRSLIVTIALSYITYVLVYKCNAELIELLQTINTKEKAIAFCWILGPIYFILIACFCLCEAVINNK